LTFAKYRINKTYGQMNSISVVKLAMSRVDEVSYAIQHLGEVQRETSVQIIKLKCQTNRTKGKKKRTI
jgi:hypothetical protein